MTLVTPLARTGRPARGGSRRASGSSGRALLYGDGLITPAISVLSRGRGPQGRAARRSTPLVVPFAVLVLVGPLLHPEEGDGPASERSSAPSCSSGSRRSRPRRARDPAHARRSSSPSIRRTPSASSPTTGEGLPRPRLRRPRRDGRRGASTPTWGTSARGRSASRGSRSSFPPSSSTTSGRARSSCATGRPRRTRSSRWFPAWGILPMVALATAATTIASQALISGVFSLTHQAVQLRFLPAPQGPPHVGDRARADLPPRDERRAPRGLRALRRSSSARRAGSRARTASRSRPRWSSRRSSSPCSCRGLARGALEDRPLRRDLPRGRRRVLRREPREAPCTAAGSRSSSASGSTRSWRRGSRASTSSWRRCVGRLRRTRSRSRSTSATVREQKPPRLDHPAVYMERFQDLVPPALVLNWEHNRALHDPILLLTVETADVPRVPPSERRRVEDLGEGFYRVLLRWGFMEEPDVPEGLRGPRPRGQAARPGHDQLRAREGRDHLDGARERNGALARAPLLLDAPQRGPRGRLLPDPARARDRVRDPGRDLTLRIG